MALKLIFGVAQTSEVYLSDKNLPVVATGIVKEMAEAPAGAKLVGQVPDDVENHALTKDGKLTVLGDAYCKAFGVSPNPESLIKFVQLPRASNTPFLREYACH